MEGRAHTHTASTREYQSWIGPSPLLFFFRRTALAPYYFGVKQAFPRSTNAAVSGLLCLNTVLPLPPSMLMLRSHHESVGFFKEDTHIPFCCRVTRRRDLVMHLWSCACTWPYSDNGGCMLSILKRTFTLVSAARVGRRGDLARTRHER